jgi:dihydrofolate reductase
MARLIYSGILSLDGYVADEQGKWDWSVPDEEVHSFVNDLQRPVGTHLYGRRMYEVLQYWGAEQGADQPAFMRDYAAIWQRADKVVYSSTLEGVTTSRTRLERTFDPEDVRRMKDEAPDDLMIGGPELAGHAVQAGLVDVFQLLVSPVAVGGGKAYWPHGVRVDLELVDQRRFGNGVVYLEYRTRA